MTERLMRIMHIITRLIIGGAQENTLLSVLGQMRAPGCAASLVVGPTTGPEGTLVDEAQREGVDYIEVPSLLRRISPLDEIRAYRALRRVIREWKPDVVHTHSSKAGVLGRLAAWHERVPLVVHTIHGLPFHPYQNRLARAFFIMAERFAARRSHRILAVAEAMVEKAVAAGVAPREKFEVVYSGIRLEDFLTPPAPPAELRRRYGLPADAVVIGKLARLFELKGHDYLLEAFARLGERHPRAYLFLVGDGLWRERLQRKASLLGIAERIAWAGLVPHERVAETIHAMDVLVHCSLREGLARVLPQALLAGKPVVGFDVDGAREVVIEGRTGRLVPAQDVEALTRVLDETLSSLPAARAMAATGRAFCRERFDHRRMVNELLRIYRAGLNERR